MSDGFYWKIMRENKDNLMNLIFFFEFDQPKNQVGNNRDAHKNGHSRGIINQNRENRQEKNILMKGYGELPKINPRSRPPP